MLAKYIQQMGTRLWKAVTIYVSAIAVHLDHSAKCQVKPVMLLDMILFIENY